jgi:outer membrane protein assembly factor BamD (BamD/ComL family)
MKKLNSILRVTVFLLLILHCIATSAERADRTFLNGIRSFRQAVSEIDKGDNPTTNVALKTAISFFQQFIANSSEDGMTPIAMEILGSAYPLQQQYQLSTQTFNEVIQRYPNHPASSQSRYKIAENLYGKSEILATIWENPLNIG